MATEKFSDFTLKASPLTTDFLVGYDGSAEIRTTIDDILQTLLPSIVSSVGSVPVGTIITHGANTPPAGYLACNGSFLSNIPESPYYNLYQVIGTTYGSGAGTFQLPDLRGYFVRGWDNGRGTDIIDGTYSQSGTAVTITTNTPHGLIAGNTVALVYSSGTGVSGTFTVLSSGLTDTVFKYTATASKTTSGNVTLTGRSHLFGKSQADALQGHYHSTTAATNTGGTPHNIPYGTGLAETLYNPAAAVTNPTTGVNGTVRVASETRPKNIALLYCIKY